MTTNLEQFEEHKIRTQERFNVWNEKQPESRKIMIRLPFTVKFPKVKFNDFETKSYVDKSTGVSGINKFKRMKFPNSQGQDVSAKVQSPSVISPRGYALMKTSKGEFKTILVVYDTENPDHECFCNNIDNEITLPAIHEVLKTPGDFGANISAIPVINETILASKEYEFGVYGIKQSMAKVLNFPKTATGFDLKSPLRTVFLSPMYFKDEKKPEDPPVEMTVYIKVDPNLPPFIITPDELMAICDGYKGIVDGKIIKGEKKGFECGPEINFQKLNAGSKPSTKFSCSSITITRFQVAPKTNSQEEKLKYLESHGVTDEYSIQMGMEELLAGLRGASLSNTVDGNTFNPMNGEIKSEMPPPTIENNSLLSSMNDKSPDVKTVIQQSSNPVNLDISQLPGVSHQTIGQQNQNNIAFSTPGIPIPMSIPGMQMPTSSFNQPVIDHSQQSFNDRLQIFNKAGSGF